MICTYLICYFVVNTVSSKLNYNCWHVLSYFSGTTTITISHLRKCSKLCTMAESNDNNPFYFFRNEQMFRDLCKKYKIT